MKQLTEPEMLHRAAAYCSAAERCIQDVEMRIKTAGLSAEASDRIIERLVQEKFIDETRFCSSFVNDKLRFNQWGRIKIAYELQRKGIPSTLRNEALDVIDEHEYQTILSNLLRSKKKTVKGKDERDVFGKLLRFAAGHGFESREAIPCLRQLFDNNDYDVEDME